MISTLANHLWQSTLFAAAAGLVSVGLRKNRAEARYWIWIAAPRSFSFPSSCSARSADTSVGAAHPRPCWLT
jgi:hypothetical protein